MRASSFIENVPQISAKPITFQRNLLRKLPRNQPFFTHRFLAKLASRIPQKFQRNRLFFSVNLSLKILQNLTFFPQPTSLVRVTVIELVIMLRIDTGLIQFVQIIKSPFVNLLLIIFIVIF